MARNKYIIKRKGGKEKFLKEAVALFGDDPDPLRELAENLKDAQSKIRQVDFLLNLKRSDGPFNLQKIFDRI